MKRTEKDPQNKSASKIPPMERVEAGHFSGRELIDHVFRILSNPDLGIANPDIDPTEHGQPQSVSDERTEADSRDADVLRKVENMVKQSINKISALFDGLDVNSGNSDVVKEVSSIIYYGLIDIIDQERKQSYNDAILNYSKMVQGAFDSMQDSLDKSDDFVGFLNKEATSTGNSNIRMFQEARTITSQLSDLDTEVNQLIDKLRSSGVIKSNVPPSFDVE